jgi:hypothetical protein
MMAVISTGRQPMTTTPPWGTPTSTEPEPAATRVPHRGFVLIVEQLTGSGENAAWRVDPAPFPSGPSREAAREAAVQLARTFQPHHPFSPRSRSIYRVNDDSLIVVVPGMTKTFHFRVSVAELIG